MWGRKQPATAPADPRSPVDLNTLLLRVARNDASAFEELYDEVADVVYGLIRRVVRDPAQSEEVAQEVLVEVWRTAVRFDPARGGAMAWIATIAHRRAVDRVRSAQAATEREERAAQGAVEIPHDEVAEQVVDRLERERVRRCLEGLSGIQRESVTLAYYGGYTYREVAERLQLPLRTIKTRMRDGLIRMRDCLGVRAV